MKLVSSFSDQAGGGGKGSGQDSPPLPPLPPGAATLSAVTRRSPPVALCDTRLERRARTQAGA